MADVKVRYRRQLEPCSSVAFARCELLSPPIGAGGYEYRDRAAQEREDSFGYRFDLSDDTTFWLRRDTARKLRGVQDASGKSTSHCYRAAVRVRYRSRSMNCNPSPPGQPCVLFDQPPYEYHDEWALQCLYENAIVNELNDGTVVWLFNE